MDSTGEGEAEVSLEPVACALCGNRQTDRLYGKFDLFIARCAHCGLVFANPRLSKEDIWKRYSPDYFWREYLPALGVRDGKYSLEHFDRRHAAMLELIAHRVRPPASLLEVGTGAGFFIKVAERAGWRVTGIEVSEEGVTFARNELRLDVRREAAEEMNFPPGSFDVIVMFEVVEHLLDPLRALHAIRQVLRPGGLLVISTPNFNALSRFGLGKDWAVLSPAEHLYYFTEASLKNLLEKTGFKDIQFMRSYAGFGLLETMNPRYTHVPYSWRTITYFALVATVGLLLFRYIQAWGRGDTLLCLAQTQ